MKTDAWKVPLLAVCLATTAGGWAALRPAPVSPPPAVVRVVVVPASPTTGPAQTAGLPDLPPAPVFTEPVTSTRAS